MHDFNNKPSSRYRTDWSEIWSANMAVPYERSLCYT